MVGVFKSIPKVEKFQGTFKYKDFEVELPPLTKEEVERYAKLRDTIKSKIAYFAERRLQDLIYEAITTNDLRLYLWAESCRLMDHSNHKVKALPWLLFGFASPSRIDAIDYMDMSDFDIILPILKYAKAKDPKAFEGEASSYGKFLSVNNSDVTDYLLENVNEGSLLYNLPFAVQKGNAYAFFNLYDKYKKSKYTFHNIPIRDAAFKNNNTEIIRTLYRDFPEDFSNSYSIALLQLFSSESDDCAYTLLEEGMDIDTLFLTACSHGRSDFMKHCHSADPDIIDRLGAKAVDKAIGSKSVETMRYLYEQGADMSAIFNAMVGKTVSKDMADLLKEIFQPKQKKVAEAVLPPKPNALKPGGANG